MNKGAEINDHYHSDKPEAYGGKNRLYTIYSKEDVDNALLENNVYSRFKEYRKLRRYSPIYVYKKRELFQSDTVFFTNKDLVKANHGYKYLFTTIDVFTKMAWIYPLKKNTCSNVMECFQDILSKCGKYPERLNSDRGSELICKQFEDFLKEKGIYHYLAYSVRKCPVVERFNLTIQKLLYKMMAKNNTLEWVKYIDSAMKIYLNRIHRTIKMSPLDGEKKENQKKLRLTYYKRYREAGRKRKKPKYKVGDTVRIWKERGNFHRGYMENFTREHFKIVEVLKNLPVPRYKLVDYDNEPIVGAFFENELIGYNPDEFYESEVIKQRKTKKGGLEYLVHYIGYPASMDRWIKAADLKEL